MPKLSKGPRAEAGFSMIDALLVLVIIGILVGVGAYVYKQNHKNVMSPTAAASTTATTTSPGSASSTNSSTNQTGTTAYINQLTQQEAESESSITSQNDNAESQAALSANSAATNVGGAYNESTL